MRLSISISLKSVTFIIKSIQVGAMNHSTEISIKTRPVGDFFLHIGKILETMIHNFNACAQMHSEYFYSILHIYFYLISVIGG